MTQANSATRKKPEFRTLPADPDWDQYRKQAKDLQRALGNGDEHAVARVRAHHPRYRRTEPTAIREANLALADAQLVIARELGFSSWPRLKTQVQALLAGRVRPVSEGFFWYADQAGRLLTQLRLGGADALQRARRWHPDLRGATTEAVAAREFSLEDGRRIVAREHGFDGWEDFVDHLEAVGKGAHEYETVDPTTASAEQERFADAVRAIQHADASALRALLEADPDLVLQRGAEGHTLLLLATQERSVEGLDLLLAAGADANEPNDEGWTPLHQAAYGEPPDPEAESPSRNLAIMELLLRAGARIDAESRGSGGTPLLQALFWGQREPAERLAREGIVPSNLRTAAGLGRLERIESFFDEAGGLLPHAGASRGYAAPHSGFPEWSPTDDPAEILADALVYAAVNGRLEAVDLLLDRGADPNAAPYQETALFGAVRRGHGDVARRLLARGADVNARGDWASMTKLTALHHAASMARLDMVKLLVEAGADLAATDEVAGGTPAGWAAHFEASDVAHYLEEVAG